nr:hypothetical protein DOP62_09245 [Synechococcus elongatus PCC 11801]
MPEKSAATRHTSSEPDDDLPELTDEMLSRVVLKQGGKRNSRPRSQSPKVAISLRLKPDVLRLGAFAGRQRHDTALGNRIEGDRFG